MDASEFIRIIIFDTSITPCIIEFNLMICAQNSHEFNNWVILLIDRSLGKVFELEQ